MQCHPFITHFVINTDLDITRSCCGFHIYPTKKETHHYDFPIKISFNYENVNCHEIFISDQILLKLEFDVDEYLTFPCAGTKYIKAKGKEVLKG